LPPPVIEDDNLPPDQQVAIPTEQDVSEGILIVAMNGGSLNTMPDSSIWANKLTVTGNGDTRWTKNLWYQDEDDVFLRHEFAGPDTIGSETNRFSAKIAQVAEIIALSGFGGQPERSTFVEMKAFGNIYGKLQHVLKYTSNEAGTIHKHISNPLLILGDIISSEGRCGY
jgi:hypothetical protein